MWKCPKCGRTFKNTNQEHYCGTFADKLKEYKTSKGAIQFPYDKPLPLELIGEIAKWCEKENGC